MKELKLGERFEFEDKYCWADDCCEWLSFTGYLVNSLGKLCVVYSDEDEYFTCRDLEDFEDMIELGEIKILKEER